MSNLEQSARQFRKELLDHNKQALNMLSHAYQVTWKKLEPQLEAITRKIEQARENGEDVKPSWLFRQERYTSFIETCKQELEHLARLGAETTIQGKTKAIDLASEHSRQLVLPLFDDAPDEVKQLGYQVEWNHFNAEAMLHQVSYLADGSPLTDLLQRYGAEAAQGIQDALVAGVATGQNPRKINASIKREFGKSLYNTLTVCRTEVMRSYRSATLENYRNNRHVVKGWIWHSACNSRTCPTCWGMHGTVHSLENELNDHPNGRCARLPLTKTWNELFPDLDLEGIKETGVKIPSGDELFKKLSPREQLAILGKAKYQAYEQGLLTLNDLAGVKLSNDWGATVYERSLKSILPGFKPTPSPVPTPKLEPNVKPGEFKSIEEAQAWAEKHYSHITWDFAETHIDTINPTLAQFDKLAQEFPEVAKRLEYIGTYASPKSKGFAGYFHNEWAHASTDGTRIGINPLWYKNPQRYRGSLVRSAKTGYHPEGCDSFESVITHEFGHHVWNWLESQTTKAVLKYVSADGTGIVADTAILWNNKRKLSGFLSEYAGKNKNERWAEAFASYYHSPKPIKFVKEQRKLLDVLHPSKWVKDYDFIRYAPEEEMEEAVKAIQKLKKVLRL
jgi:SPP1 gp7 family putative phage head morphogenesis protein